MSISRGRKRTEGRRSGAGAKTHLKTTTMWPFEETGFAVSRYAVKLSSLQRISGCFAAAEGERGEEAEAVDAMLHMRQPGLGAKAMAGALVLRGAEGDGESKEEAS